MYNFHITIILRVWYVYIIILVVLYKVVIRVVIITQTNRNFVINRTINNFTTQLLNTNQQITPLSLMHAQFRRNLRAPFIPFLKKENEHKQALEQGKHKGHVSFLNKVKELFSFNRGHEHNQHRKVLEKLQGHNLQKGGQVEVVDGPVDYEVSIRLGDNDDPDNHLIQDDEDDDIYVPYPQDDGDVEVVHVIAFPEHPPSPPVFHGTGPHKIGGGRPTQPGRSPRVHGRSQNKFLSTSLGYGSNGDQCIVNNFSQFSGPCQDAILALEEVHFSIASEQVDDYHHHHHHHHPIIVLLILSGLGYIFYRRHQKMRSIRQILNVIEANPSLKAQVEQVAGVPIPPHNSILASGCNAASCAFKSVGMVALFFFFFCFVVITSGIMTGILLNKHHHHKGNYDDDDGIAGFVIFLAIAAIETAIIRKFVWHRITNSCGCTEEVDYNERAAAAAAGGDAGRYAPLSDNSTHMSELTAYPISTGTTGTSPMSREVRPSSRLTML
jgi:hypothetical protein